MTQQLTGNKGEWSEFYVLLKTLAQGQLSTGVGVDYPVAAVIDTSSSAPTVYAVQEEHIDIYGPSGQIDSQVSRTEVAELADRVLEATVSGSGAYSVAAATEFMNAHGITGLHTQAAGKTDIELDVYDPPTCSMLRLGFSIKSLIGSSPTLFNASGDSTNFVFEVVGVDPDEDTILGINSLQGSKKYRDRVAAICALGGTLVYRDVANGILDLNLRVTDSNLPEILASALVAFYSGKGGKLSDLVAVLEVENPCGFDQSYGHPYYEHKMKAFLRDAALGMTASRVWTGEIEATGGYIVVGPDGAMTCVHANDMNAFEEYLLQSTSLDGPSGTRHGYGEAYEGPGTLMFKLPLQVRFTG